MENTKIDDLFFKYNEALKVLNKKFKKIYINNLENQIANPIDHIQSRIKTKHSIEEKLKNKYYNNYTAENIDNMLNDVAGIRIVCPFLRDIEKVIEYINNDKDIKVIKVKNYIKTPKNNGYSSYHMIVYVPVLINEKIEYVKAEIQIRTLAMDVIASLEHKIRYKKNSINQEEIDEKMNKIINFVNLIDKELNRFIENNESKSILNISQSNIKAFCSTSELDEFLKYYKIALKKVEYNLNLLNEDYLKNNLISPIDHISGRIKPLTSIINKLREKNNNLTLENIENHINDIGAIKIVCSFLKDANEIIEFLNNQPDLTVLETQDYIANPKECGYSSYHFIVSIPVSYENEQKNIKFELQVRTIIMDFWANIEHILCYKKEGNEQTKKELKKIANYLRIIEYELNQLAISKNYSYKKSNRKILEKN